MGAQVDSIQIDLSGDVDPEGDIFTIPVSKYANSKNGDDYGCDDIRNFVEKYKLTKLKHKIITEGITVDFLLSQTDDQIDAISRELTFKAIQRNKFKFAVNCLKATEKKNNLAPIEPKGIEHFIEENNRKKFDVDRKIETVKTNKMFKDSDSKTIISWYFKGSDAQRHEIILKYTHSKKGKKHKKKIIVDGKVRFSKHSDDINFVIQKLKTNSFNEHLQIEIDPKNDYNPNAFCELFINEIPFSSLLEPKPRQRTPSFSL